MFELYKKVIDKGMRQLENGRVMLGDDVNPVLPALFDVISSLRESGETKYQPYILETVDKLKQRILTKLSEQGLTLNYAPHPLTLYLNF